MLSLDYRLYVSPHYDLHRREHAFHTVRALHTYTGYIEPLAARQSFDPVTLSEAEIGALRYLGYGIPHLVKEDCLETEHPETYVEYIVVDRRPYAGGGRKHSLGHRLSTLIPVFGAVRSRE